MESRNRWRSSISAEMVSTSSTRRSGGGGAARGAGSGSPRRLRHSLATRCSSLSSARSSDGHGPAGIVISRGRPLPPPYWHFSWSRAFSSSVEKTRVRGGRYASFRMRMSAMLSSIAPTVFFRRTKSMGRYWDSGRFRWGTATLTFLRDASRGSRAPTRAPPPTKEGLGPVGAGFVVSLG